MVVSGEDDIFPFWIHRKLNIQTKYLADFIMYTGYVHSKFLTWIEIHNSLDFIAYTGVPFSSSRRKKA